LVGTLLPLEQEARARAPRRFWLAIATACAVALPAAATGGSAASAAVQMAEVATGSPPTLVAAPSISGISRQGQTLTADPGSWSGTSSITFAYQWRRCTFAGSPCSDIGGATATVYTLGETDVGATIRIAVTASNSEGSATAASAPTAAVSAQALAIGDPVIAAAGDIACDPTDPNFNGGVGTSTYCHQKNTSDLLVNAGLSGVLAVGDVQYWCDGAGAFSKSYGPTWGRVKSITHPTTGNHEYYTSGGTDCDTSGKGEGYFTYFGASAGDPAKGYYSFDVGSWHLVALNSSCSKVGGCGVGSPQEQWLKADLAAHPTACTLAYWHHSRFSSKTPGTMTQALWQDLYDAGAELALTGHVHNYERLAPQDPNGVYDPAAGIREIVVGTGGKSLEGFPTTLNPNSEVRGRTFGILRLTLHARSYDWQFVPEAGKTFTDSGSTFCHGGGPDATPPETSIISGPSGSVPTTSASFSFASSEPDSTFDCTLDGAPFTPCSSPVSYAGLAEGSHSFHVRATDAAGNADPTPATGSWTVDVTPPQTSIDSGPPAETTSATAGFSFSSSESASTFACSLDGAVFTSCSSPAFYSGLAQGSHSFQVRATDTAGNADPTPAVATWTVLASSDATPPTVALTAPAAGATVSGTVTLTATAADDVAVDHVEFLVGAVIVGTDSSAPYSVAWNSAAVPDGLVTISARAIDTAGNSATSPGASVMVANGSLFSDGFESGDLSAWTNVVTGGDGSAAAQNAVVRSGSFAAELTETGNTGSVAYLRKTFDTARSDLIVSAWFQLLAEGVSGGNVPVFRLLDAGGGRIISVYRQNLSGDKLWVTYGGVYYSTSGTLPIGAWGKVELRVIGAGTGAATVTVLLNGSVVYQSTSATLASAVAKVQIGNETARQAFTLVVDDVVATG